VPNPQATGVAAEMQRQWERVNVTDRAENLMTWVENVSIFDDEGAGGDKSVHGPR